MNGHYNSSFIANLFLYCSDFYYVTITTTTSLVTVVRAGVVTAIMTFAIAFTAVRLPQVLGLRINCQ